jgi:glyoxylase I family protein
MARVKNVGAVMIYADDAAALSEWYARVLGIETKFNEADGWYEGEVSGAGSNGSLHFGIHPAEGGPAPGRRVMVNYEVDDFDDFVSNLARHDVEVTRTIEEDYGRFVHFKDPEGNPVEVWSPAAE